MAALLVALSVMAVLMTAVMPVWHHMAQREREEEWVFRGRQYAGPFSCSSAKPAPACFPPRSTFWLTSISFARNTPIRLPEKTSTSSIRPRAPRRRPDKRPARLDPAPRLPARKARPARPLPPPPVSAAHSRRRRSRRRQIRRPPPRRAGRHHGRRQLEQGGVNPCYRRTQPLQRDPIPVLRDFRGTRRRKPCKSGQQWKRAGGRPGQFKRPRDEPGKCPDGFGSAVARRIQRADVQHAAVRQRQSIAPEPAAAKPERAAGQAIATSDRQRSRRQTHNSDSTS